MLWLMSKSQKVDNFPIEEDIQWFVIRYRLCYTSGTEQSRTEKWKILDSMISNNKQLKFLFLIFLEKKHNIFWKTNCSCHKPQTFLDWEKCSNLSNIPKYKSFNILLLWDVLKHFHIRMEIPSKKLFEKVSHWIYSTEISLGRIKVMMDIWIRWDLPNIL